MLCYLKVENLAVVEKAELAFAPGLNILTGETGAGKSILIDAIQLLIQRKTPAHVIRKGQKKLMVEAVFSRGEDETVLRRDIEAERSLTFINNRATPFTQVKDLASSFLNIYGQKDHSFLLNPANHQAFLDRYARNETLLEKLATACRDIKKKSAELAELKRKRQQIDEKIDFLHFQIAEIESLNMNKGDDTALEERHRLLSSAEEIVSRATALLGDLYQDDQSLYSRLATRMADVAFLQAMFPEFSPFKEEIERFYSLLPELSAFLSERVGKLEYSEGELNLLEEKRLKLGNLQAKYKLKLDGLLDKLEELKSERSQLLNLDVFVGDKEKEIAAGLELYRGLMTELRSARSRCGRSLSESVQKELALLEMKKARFEARVGECEPTIETVTERGCDTVEFYFSSNPGQEPAPLAEVASGGELSRLMLVLKALLSEESGSTFIFDEIDSGIGGKTAEFVGEKLRKISRSNQVICISHLPQIASFADRHFQVTKEFRANQTFSSARPLEEGERVQEIARLMAGSAINEDVLKAAESLIQKNRS